MYRPDALIPGSSHTTGNRCNFKSGLDVCPTDFAKRNIGASGNSLCSPWDDRVWCWNLALNFVLVGLALHCYFENLPRLRSRYSGHELEDAHPIYLSSVLAHRNNFCGPHFASEHYSTDQPRNAIPEQLKRPDLVVSMILAPFFHSHSPVPCSRYEHVKFPLLYVGVPEGSSAFTSLKYRFCYIHLLTPPDHVRIVSLVLPH